MASQKADILELIDLFLGRSNKLEQNYILSLIPSHIIEMRIKYERAFAVGAF